MALCKLSIPIVEIADGNYEGSVAMTRCDRLYVIWRLARSLLISPIYFIKTVKS